MVYFSALSTPCVALGSSLEAGISLLSVVVLTTLLTIKPSSDRFRALCFFVWFCLTSIYVHGSRQERQKVNGHFVSLYLYSFHSYVVRVCGCSSFASLCGGCAFIFSCCSAQAEKVQLDWRLCPVLPINQSRLFVVIKPKETSPFVVKVSQISYLAWPS